MKRWNASFACEVGPPWMTTRSGGFSSFRRLVLGVRRRIEERVRRAPVRLELDRATLRDRAGSIGGAFCRTTVSYVPVSASTTWMPTGSVGEPARIANGFGAR